MNHQTILTKLFQNEVGIVLSLAVVQETGITGEGIREVGLGIAIKGLDLDLDAGGGSIAPLEVGHVRLVFGDRVVTNTAVIDSHHLLGIPGQDPEAFLSLVINPIDQKELGIDLDRKHIAHTVHYLRNTIQLQMQILMK